MVKEIERMHERNKKKASLRSVKMMRHETEGNKM